MGGFEPNQKVFTLLIYKFDVRNEFGQIVVFNGFLTVSAPV